MSERRQTCCSSSTEATAIVLRISFAKVRNYSAVNPIPACFRSSKWSALDHSMAAIIVVVAVRVATKWVSTTDYCYFTASEYSEVTTNSLEVLAYYLNYKS